MAIDFEGLWKRVTEQFACRTNSVHGPSHWRNVERNGLLLAEHCGADIDVVRLFALFHDSRRVTDGWDPGHGARGAEYAAELRSHAYGLAEQQFETLQYACVPHTDGQFHRDPTIAACWDADRLDLGRVRVMPDPKRMCTPLGRHIAGIGGVDQYLRDQSPKS